MNSKGLFSFVLVFAFCFFLLAFLSFNAFSQSKLSDSFNTALMLEKSNFERSIIEQNTDFLIERTIELQALKKQVSSGQILAAINSSLTAYFQKINSSGSFSFFTAEFPFQKYSQILEIPAIPFHSFTDEFKVNAVKLEKNLYLVDAGYAGGLFGNRLVFALSNSKAEKQFFLIPFKYNIRKLVVS